MSQISALGSLSALAQESRLEVFRLLVQAGDSGLPAGAIAQRLNLPASSLSFHLNNLAQGQLVTTKREGRSIIYFANFDQMRGLVAYLLENCCSGECGPDISSLLEKDAVL
ncbi:MAG: metalloregulator ArsR/SmtB family transcription factor [Erythrobacter sp.]